MSPTPPPERLAERVVRSERSLFAVFRATPGPRHRYSTFASLLERRTLSMAEGPHLNQGLVGSPLPLVQRLASAFGLPLRVAEAKRAMAMNSLHSIAQRLGGDVVGRRSIVIPGPGHSHRDRSLSVTFRPDAPDGFRVHSHAGDDWKECRDHIRSLLGIERWSPSRVSPTAPKRAVQVEDTGKDSTIAFALKIWDEATDPRGTVVETYLRHRGLEFDHIVVGEALRFHPALKLNDEGTPAMVALFRDIVTNEPCGIHRTFLTLKGDKLDRKMLGRSANAAIKLDPDDAVTTGLAIGEGIETVMTGRIAGFQPAWALGSSGKIGTFPVLPGIEALTVLVETNDGGASERALRVCANRWLSTGAEVFAVTPKHGGDLNDLIQRDCQ
jgi:hypothetical protein